VAPEAAGVDLTAAVIERLSEGEMNMIERADRELERYED
jgi:hypothetical protein